MACGLALYGKGMVAVMPVNSAVSDENQAVTAAINRQRDALNQIGNQS